MLALPEISGPVNDAHWAIEGVHAEHAPVAWRRCWELLSRAVDRFPQAKAVWTEGLMLNAILLGQSQLWIAWSHDRRQIEGAVVTCLSTTDEGKKICELPFVAGEGVAEWGPPILALIRAWAEQQGSEYLVGYGRKGWKRLFGFSEYGVTKDGLPILIRPVREVPNV